MKNFAVEFQDIRNFTIDLHRRKISSIREAISEGYTFTEIGKWLGVSRQAVCNELRYYARKEKEQNNSPQPL